jgi:drug/metabolite transporter (DMT)-like permease
MNKKVQAHVALFTAQVIYAASFPIAKMVMQDIPYNVLVLVRGVGAMLLFWTSSFLLKESVDKKDLPRLFLLGICGVAINQTLFLKGLSLTSPINAAIMMISTPILVLIIASLLIKEKITKIRAIGILVGFTGAVFLVLQNAKGGSLKESSFLGDIYVFINALSWGTFLVIVKPLMKKYHTITILKWVFVFGLVFIFPLGIKDTLAMNWNVLSAKLMLCTAFVIVFTTFIAYLLNTLALKELSSSIVSVYIYLQPLLTAFISICIFHSDAITWEKTLAAVLIFAGVYLTGIQTKKAVGEGLEPSRGD